MIAAVRHLLKSLSKPPLQERSPSELHNLYLKWAKRSDFDVFETAMGVCGGITAVCGFVTYAWYTALSFSFLGLMGSLCLGPCVVGLVSTGFKIYAALRTKPLRNAHTKRTRDEQEARDLAFRKSAAVEKKAVLERYKNFMRAARQQKSRTAVQALPPLRIGNRQRPEK